MSWQTPDPGTPAQRSGAPLGPPPGASPIPPYQPPQPGQWGPHGAATPQDYVPGQAAAPPPRQQFRYAELSERIGATLIDGGLILGLTLLLSLVTFGVLEELIGAVWFAASGYVAWLNGSKGQSPGKALLGLKVVRDVDGTTLGGPVGLARTFSLWVMGAISAGLLVVIAVLMPAGSAKKQALHDKLFGATVVAGYPRASFGKGIFRP